jgi:hypothetical protein
MWMFVTKTTAGRNHSRPQTVNISMESASFRNYLTAFTSRWFIAMSGPISVPAAIAALYVENPTAKILLGLTACTAFVLCSFWIWKIEREKRNDAEAKLGAVVAAFPDWSIHELFTHIRPDLLSRVDSRVGDTWDEVGNEIRDHAALGNLKLWGRPMRSGGAMSLLGERQTLRLIEPSYWSTAYFRYSFFDETAVGQSQTYSEPGRSSPEYTDLQVNKSQALSLWPK